MSNRGCKSRRDGWWGLGPAAGLKSNDELGLGVKSVLRERNGASSGVDAESVATKRLTWYTVVRDRMTSAEKAFTITYRKFFAYIPGSFIPAIRRAKLGLPICLNIFFICAY